MFHTIAAQYQALLAPARKESKNRASIQQSGPPLMVCNPLKPAHVDKPARRPELWLWDMYDK